MKALCDTHVLLWYLEGRQEMFSPRIQAFLMDERNTLCFSDASIWELAIKASLRKDVFPHDPQRIVDELLDQGFEEDAHFACGTSWPSSGCRCCIVIRLTVC